MKNTLAALMITAAIAAAQSLPPIVHDIESDGQQTQTLTPLSLQQGANAAYRVRVNTRGQWWNLAGLTARLDIRESATATNAYQLASSATATSATPHYFSFAISPTQTGIARSNWLYSVAVISGDSVVPLGEGRIDIKAGTWTGTATAPSALPWNWGLATAYINTSTFGPYIFGEGFAYATNGAGRLLITSLAGTPAWESITGKPETFPPSPHDYTAITNAPWLLSFTELDPIWGASSNAVLQHVASTGNPHGTTAAQVGAVATNDATYLDTASLAAGALPRTGGAMDGTDAEITNLKGLRFQNATRIENLGSTGMGFYNHTNRLGMALGADGVTISRLFATGIEAITLDVSGRLTAGSYSATNSPYQFAWSTNIVLSLTNGLFQAVTNSITGPTTITWPAASLGSEQMISLTIPAAGTNTVTLSAANGAYYVFISPLTSGGANVSTDANTSLLGRSFSTSTNWNITVLEAQ